jgi:hypothetical protein
VQKSRRHYPFTEEQAATLQVNTRHAHPLLLHAQNPSAMDAGGILNGRRVAEGEKIGVVSKTAPRTVFVTGSYCSKRLARWRMRISLGE